METGWIFILKSISPADIFKKQELTCVVRLVEEQPAMAWLVTWPLNTELIELKKLDFPAPIGPMSRTRAWGTELIRGL